MLFYFSYLVLKGIYIRYIRFSSRKFGRYQRDTNQKPYIKLKDRQYSEQKKKDKQ